MQRAYDAQQEESSLSTFLFFVILNERLAKLKDLIGHVAPSRPMRSFGLAQDDKIKTKKGNTQTQCSVLHYLYMWILYALLSAAAASLVVIFGKIGVKGIDSTLATAIRAGVMFLLMTLAAASLKKLPEIIAVPGKILSWIVLSGAAGAVSWFFYFLALKHGPAGGTAALDRLSVVFVIILAALFLGEKLTLMHAAGAVLLTTGAILLVL